MMLNTEDLELLHALQIAPRAPWSSIAPVLGRHPATLASRWSRLTETGSAWVTATLSGRPEQTCLAFIDVECSPSTTTASIETFCQDTRVSSVIETSESWELQVTVVTLEWQELVGSVLPWIQSVPGVLRTRLRVTTAMHIGGGHQRLDVLDQAQAAVLAALRMTAERPAAIPPSDLPAIFAVLASDGRATARDVAAVTGMHPTTVGRHLKTVVGMGLVDFRCEVAQGLVGCPISCQWYVRAPPAAIPQAVAFLDAHRTLRFCAEVTGSANLTFMLYLQTPADIAEFEARLLRTVPDLRVVDSTLAVRTHKMVGWLIREDSTTGGPVGTPSDHLGASVPRRNFFI
jgi:DNA-binding Lrp family transcriptional regulator